MKSKVSPAFVTLLREFVLPFALTAASYDGLRYVLPLVRTRVRVEEPYLFDKTWFGIPGADGQIFTPNEWWQLHTHWTLDLVCGFFYLTFLLLFVLTAAYFRAKLGRKPLARLMPWGFFWLNCLGYVTYALYPAAPPWYAARHGLGPVDLSAAPDPAGCLRFDQLLGTNFFSGMYGKTATVFGAIPSLHVAYPMLAAYLAFRLKAARVWSASFFLIMAFSAVYLNHHYVLDALWGAAYAVLVGYALERYASRLPEHERPLKRKIEKHADSQRRQDLGGGVGNSALVGEPPDAQAVEKQARA